MVRYIASEKVSQCHDVKQLWYEVTKCTLPFPYAQQHHSALAVIAATRERSEMGRIICFLRCASAPCAAYVNSLGCGREILHHIVLTSARIGDRIEGRRTSQ